MMSAAGSAFLLFAAILCNLRGGHCNSITKWPLESDPGFVLFDGQRSTAYFLEFKFCWVAQALAKPRKPSDKAAALNHAFTIFEAASNPHFVPLACFQFCLALSISSLADLQSLSLVCFWSFLVVSHLSLLSLLYYLAILFGALFCFHC